MHGSADTLDQHVSTQDFDYIISIDSAYHYNTRWKFIQTAFSYLNPQGTLGLYDLCLDPEFMSSITPMQKQLLGLICQLIHVPLENLVTPEEYKSKMMAMGYQQIEMVCLDRMQVFGGLSNSFQLQYETVLKYGIGVSLPNRIMLKVSSFIFGLFSTRSWIIPVLVKGKK